MPTSEKRVAANRANAAKSTGPRTPEGKEKAKLNAIVHGLTAQTAVLPGEDRGELEALSQSLMAQLSPRGVVQRLIAGRVVSLAWKLRRVARAEEAIAAEMNTHEVETWKRKREFNADLGYEALKQGARPKGRDAGALLAASFAETNTKSGEGRLIRLTQYELKLDAALRSAVRELRTLQREDGFDTAEEVIDVVGETPEAETPSRETPQVVAEANEPKVSGPPTCNGRGDTCVALVHSRKDDGDTSVAPTNEPSNHAWPTSRKDSDQTNPTREPAPRAQDSVIRGSPPGNSSPAPRTSASPPPGPRR